MVGKNGDYANGVTMVKHHNTTIDESTQRLFNFKVGENVPDEVANFIQPVKEIAPFGRQLVALFNRTTTASGTTLVNLGTAFPNRTVYITGIMVSNVQDATSDNVLISVTLTMDGGTQYLYIRRKPTTTASVTQDYQAFPVPIKVDRNGFIFYNCAFTAGTSTLDIVLYGYVDN